jgi:pyruvate/2-oxoglutarate/acetoin dehydrogenase E1 component
VRRAGSDVTIVGAARAVEIALEAADGLATEGVALEVRGRRIPSASAVVAEVVLLS